MALELIHRVDSIDEPEHLARLQSRVLVSLTNPTIFRATIDPHESVLSLMTLPFSVPRCPEQRFWRYQVSVESHSAIVDDATLELKARHYAQTIRDRPGRTSDGDFSATAVLITRPFYDRLETPPSSQRSASDDLVIDGNNPSVQAQTDASSSDTALSQLPELETHLGQHQTSTRRLSAGDMLRTNDILTRTQKEQNNTLVNHARSLQGNHWIQKPK